MSSSGINGWNKKTLGALLGFVATLLLLAFVGPIPTFLIGGAALVIGFFVWLNKPEDTEEEDSDTTPDSSGSSESAPKKTTSKAGTKLAHALDLTEDETDDFIAAYQQLLVNPRPFIGFWQSLSREQQSIVAGHFNTLFGRLGLTVRYIDPHQTGHFPALPPRDAQDLSPEDNGHGPDQQTNTGDNATRQASPWSGTYTMGGGNWQAPGFQNRTGE